MKVELSDRGYSNKIVAHDTITLADDFNFDDYYSVVKPISQELYKYFNGEIINSNNMSYTRIYVYLYYN